MDGQYGPLTGLVGPIGSIIAAGGAILLTWRGRARWEPSEEDLPKAPQQVAGLATAVLIAVLWGLTRGQTSSSLLAALAIGLLVLAVLSLLAYGFAIRTQTYDDQRRHRKIIGGFKLTPEALLATAGQADRTQEYLATAGFNPDKVWSKRSRALAIGVFALLYLALVVSGSMSLAAAAILIEKEAAPATPLASPASTPVSPTGTPAAPIVSARTLRWTDAESGGAMLDGGVLSPAKKVWLQELFPASPPSRFQIVESVDPGWPSAVQDAVAALEPPPFAPIVSGYSAVSDSAWQLPSPLIGMGSRTFSFVDQNPEGAPTRSGTIIVGAAIVEPGEGGPSCPAPDAGGGVSGQVGQPGCAQFLVTAGTDPNLDVSVLTPWGEGESSLLAAIGGWFRSLEAATAQETPPAFDADKTLEAFSEQYAGSLPRSLPPGWEISTDATRLSLAGGQSSHVSLQVRADSAGSAIVAIKLTDRSNGMVILSPLIPIVIRGDAPPSVTIVDPPADILGVNRLPYTGSDENGWYADVKVVANGSDSEDGVLAPSAFAWSTDRSDLQAADLGSGLSLSIRLYSHSCEGGAIHFVTVTVTDSAGVTATASRQIEIGQAC